MHVLFPTGRQSEKAIRDALSGVDDFSYDICISGEIASFITERTLERMLSAKKYDCAVITGMAAASFENLSERLGINIYKGTRHAADMRICVPLIRDGKLSKTIPADELLSGEKRKAAADKLKKSEEEADCEFEIRGVKFGKDSRIKIIFEIMDAHRCTNLRETALRAFDDGADAVDLGFGFDADEDDVIRCFKELEDIPHPLSADTLDPKLIKAALFRADIIFSLTKKIIPELAEDVVNSNAAAVLIPRDDALLTETICAAKSAGLKRIFADPILMPPLSGMTESLGGYLTDYGVPKVLGCVNVIELMDADSPGICAMLASSAAETKCCAVLISEHSDKTKCAVREMRRAIDLMTLSRGRPYPKDAGCDVFVIKEKRRRSEPELIYDEIRDAVPCFDDDLSLDPKGNFRIGIKDGYIIAVRHGKAIRGKNWHDVFSEILKEDGVSLLDHAAYLGKELYKAELALRFSRSFEQDGEF